MGYYRGETHDARALLERFRSPEVSGADRVVRAEALSELAALVLFEGDVGDAGPLLDEALATLELEQAWPALASALVNRSVYLLYNHRAQEGAWVLRQALQLADEHDLAAVALRARTNLVQISIESNRFAEVLDQVHEGLSLARERGDRHWERRLIPLLAKALLERSRRHEDPEALREARAIYEELGATRWLERLDQTSGVPA